MNNVMNDHSNVLF